MQLSLHADYACRVLIYLATTEKEKSSIDDVAAAFSISQNHLVKVVHKLGLAGYIETTRGRGGGISLAHSPDEITIGKVVRDFEPHFDIVECFNSEKNTCPIIGSCGLKPWLKKATFAFLKSLDEVALADVIRNKKRISNTLNSESSEIHI